MEKDYFNEMKLIAINAIEDIINMFNDNNINDVFFTDDFYILTPTCEKHKLTNISCYDNELTFYTENGSTFKCDDLILTIFAELHPIIKQEIERMVQAMENEHKKINEVCSYTKKLFILPKEHITKKLDDSDFCGKAFKYGKVLTIEQFVKEFNLFNGNHFDFVDVEMRYLEYSDTCVEYCPHCGNEVLFESKFEKQECPICKQSIAPCSLCDTCTDDCPFRKS